MKLLTDSVVEMRIFLSNFARAATVDHLAA